MFHALARGNDGQIIFQRRKEWDGFLDLLSDIRGEDDFRLLAYCMMSNHFHVLVEIEDTPLSKIMHRLMTTWSKRFNIARRRIGHVFQGRFKAIIVNDDAYLIHLLRYIHLNPIKAGLVRSPEEWPWSGHREIMGRHERGLIDSDRVLNLFDPDRKKALAQYERHVLDGMDDPAAMEHPMPERTAARPTPRKPRLGAERLDLDALVSKAGEETGIAVATIRGRGRSWAASAARRAFIADAYSAGHSLTSIAAFLDISQSATSRALQKVK
ncbi:MAG: transposase [Elusimicrobiota bacterium]